MNKIQIFDDVANILSAVANGTTLSQIIEKDRPTVKWCGTARHSLSFHIFSQGGSMSVGRCWASGAEGPVHAGSV